MTYILYVHIYIQITKNRNTYVFKLDLTSEGSSKDYPTKRLGHTNSRVSEKRGAPSIYRAYECGEKL